MVSDPFVTGHAVVLLTGNNVSSEAVRSVKTRRRMRDPLYCDRNVDLCQTRDCESIRRIERVARKNLLSLLSEWAIVIRRGESVEFD